MKKWVQAFTLMFMIAPVAAAQTTKPAPEYPIRPVRIITGSPGSTSDLVARFIAQKFTERWGQQVVVDNRTGVGGVIGTEIGSRASPDGYTLTVGHIGTHASPQFLYKKLPYDPIKDFVPITQLSNSPIVLVVHPSVPAKDLKAFIDYARNKPGGLNYSTPGGGTSGNLTGELFNQVTGAKLVHIPYKGAGFALTGVVSGETQASFLASSTAIGQVKAGKVRGLAVVGKTRFAGMPDLPSTAEQGYPDLDSNVWFGLFAPAGTPKAIITKINRDAVAALKSKEAQDFLLAQGAIAAPSTPEAFDAFVKSEIARWGKVIRDAGIKPN
jgi:tripartite-type tricarboxylate transporter receptor subunit TctC